jgi:hypothetical protein
MIIQLPILIVCMAFPPSVSRGISQTHSLTCRVAILDELMPAPWRRKIVTN